jgi:hypothetical protein
MNIYKFSWDGNAARTFLTLASGAIASRVVLWVSLAVGLDECGVACNYLTIDGSSIRSLARIYPIIASSLSGPIECPIGFLGGLPALLWR